MGGAVDVRAGSPPAPSGPSAPRLFRADPRARSTRCCTSRSASAAPTPGDDVLSLLLEAAPRGRQADERSGAARRARDAARRRPRDDGDRPRPGPPSGSSGCPAAGRRCGAAGRSTRRRPARRRCGCARCCRSSLRHLQAPMTIAGLDLPGRHGRGALDLPRAPAARRSTPTPARFRPERFLGDAPAGRHLHLDPVRRRRPPLPRRRLRADGAARRPGRARPRARRRGGRPPRRRRPAGGRSRWCPARGAEVVVS